MKCDILTLFPDMVAPVLNQSILKRAQAKGLCDIRVHPLRDFTPNGQADDYPYGGGPGMVLKPEPIYAAVEQIQKERQGGIRIILPSPQGVRFDQRAALSYAGEQRSLLFICGHYEGVDARVREGLPVEEVSVGDYILTGGELAALMMIDAAARLVPGVLGGPTSTAEESFSSSLLEYPHYTRPYSFRGMAVPEVLVSGDHGAIRQWRRKQAILTTALMRPDLLHGAVADAGLTDEEQEWVMEMDRATHSIL
jgi:tRNA (guanine37-N1)-methyltransferase